MTTTTPQHLPPGLELTDTGLVAHGVVARQLATHVVAPRPGRTMSNCKFDDLAGNTMLGMHLAQIPPAGTKCNHRHLDETMAFIVSGRGWTELRQSDDRDVNRVEWEAGDLVVVPCNAWHRHVNADAEHPARQLSFRNTAFMYRVLHGEEGRYTPDDPAYNNTGARFPDRFDDQPGYFEIRERIGPRRVRAHALARVADEQLPGEDPSLGSGVAVQYYSMGGQRTLDVALLDLRPAGFVRPHRPLAEEAFVVLRGSGRTDLYQPDGALRSVPWRAGDLVCPPLGVWRQHVADPDSHVRLLKVRHVALERALGLDVDEPALHTTIPDRFPTLIEPGVTAPAT